MAENVEQMIPRVDLLIKCLLTREAHCIGNDDGISDICSPSTLLLIDPKIVCQTENLEKGLSWLFSL